MCGAFLLINLFIHLLTGYATMPSSLWYDTCRQIMVGLLSIIDCLYFFFPFSLLKTKVHICDPFYLLFVKSIMIVKPKKLGFNMVARPTHFEPGNHVTPTRLDLTIMSDLDAWVKIFKIFQKHIWIAKTNIGSSKQDFLFIYNKI